MTVLIFNSSARLTRLCALRILCLYDMTPKRDVSGYRRASLVKISANNLVRCYDTNRKKPVHGSGSVYVRGCNRFHTTWIECSYTMGVVHTKQKNPIYITKKEK